MMKKTIIASMVLAVGLLASPVMASEQSAIDYDSMSTEELVALRDEINAQIADRGGDNVITQGKYVVGTDIKATSFKMICYGDDTVNFTIYDSEEDFQTGYDAKSDQQWNDPGNTEGIILNLKEGQIVDVTRGSAVVEEITASWAPEN